MISVTDLTKCYATGNLVQKALDGVSLTFRDSEFVAILGPSGSGKTTFLNILGGFDHADSGEICVGGVSTKDYTDADWDTYRNHRVGFIFQSYNLIPHQTVLANVELACTLAGEPAAERTRRAREALDRVGLSEHVNKRPSQLSGGQMQRVAIARALVNDPEIVLADEPTGALDTETGIQVMDLLAEVARERLVIMVTHNPQLADDYATRIVRIKDGHVVGDTKPVTEEERWAFLPHGAEKPAKRSSMSFLTALSLSFHNLMTKKGRTVMTAFAGSIGIMGIAAILALSNGVNDYIAKVEQDTLSSYPLTIARQSYDMTSMLSEDTGGKESGDAPDEGESRRRDAASGSSERKGSDRIPVLAMLSDMFASVKANDMSAFKRYLDGSDTVHDAVSAIQYDYGISPIVYRQDGDDATMLSPNAMTEVMSGGASSAATAGTMLSGVSAYTEMIDDPALLDSQYDVVAGRWARAADECVLVLSKSGCVSDYTLYSTGVLDPAEMASMVDATMAGTGGAGDVAVPRHDVHLSYEDALSLRFKVLAPTDFYRKNQQTGGWTDMRADEAFMAKQASSGLDLKVVGVVKPSPTARTAALSQGIAYTHGLTDALMARANDSEIVRQQRANPQVDVFTGKTFDSLQEEAKRGVDLAKLFHVDEAALGGAFGFDERALAESLAGASTELGADAGVGAAADGAPDMKVDVDAVLDELDFSQVIADAPSPDMSAALEELQKNPPLSQGDLERASGLMASFANGFVTQWLPLHGSGLDVSAPDFGEKLLAQFGAYASSAEKEGGKSALDELGTLVGEPVVKSVRGLMEGYVRDDLAPYMTGSVKEMVSAMTQAIGTSVSEQVRAAISARMGQMAQAMAPRLASAMGRALRVDAAKLEGAISVNMDATDLSSLMTSYANASRLTYDQNLATLGSASADDPAAVRIYPKDFSAKQTVVDAIAAYNKKVEDAGSPDAAIVYTDYMGVVMSSVTSIVNMISLVLIAFVSISLVVSSIMIGIITYISVLERKKEIGILRAMGASKRNVASVFNAETFIEGLIAGLLAVGVVALVSVPVNAWALAVYHVDGVMRLPVASALGLVAVSVGLTVIAGLIPARSAARRDPVEALRSE